MTALDELAGIVRRTSGIVLERAQLPSLAAAAARAAPGRSAEQVLAVLGDPVAGPPLLDGLIDEVAVQETFFFRHARELATIDWRGLRDAAAHAGRGAVRVWSAACATGEEPYTLAILACEALGSGAPPVSILATDISARALERASRARYGARAVRELSQARRERWFHAAGRELAVADPLRQLVRLQRHNLISEPIPPAGEALFDVIVCRNVLIYFDRPTVQRLLGALERALAPGGLLIIGAADRLSGPLPRAAPPPRARSRPPRSPQRPPRSPQRSPRSPQRPARSASASATRPPSGGVTRALRQIQATSVEQIAEQTGGLLAEDPLNADAYFVHGVAQLAAGDAEGAVGSLRRALYLEPDFALAAFKLARAHEALDDPSSARRAYRRALRSLRVDDPRSAALLEQLDLADVATACRRRLAVLDRS